MPTNILVKEIPSQAIARFSRLDARAVIETPDGKVYSFDLSRPNGQRVREEQKGFHEGMWLQPGIAELRGYPIESLPAGEFPFRKLEEYIDFEYRARAALMYFIMSLDPDLDIETRKMDAQKATEMLEDNDLRAAVEPALMSSAMSPELDMTYGPSEGKAGEILKAMVAKQR